MKMFDQNASNNTKLKISAVCQVNTANSSEEMNTIYRECIDTESFKNCYESIQSEFAGYKSINPATSVHIEIKGQLKGKNFENDFNSIDSYRQFLIESNLIDSKDLDDMDQNIKPCLVM